MKSSKTELVFSQIIAICAATTLLVGGAILKWIQLASTPSTKNLILGSQVAESLIILFELGLAFWLISGWRFPIATRVTTIVLTIFVFVNLAAFLGGRSSCGCFGLVQVHPLVTLLLDLVVVVLFLTCTMSVRRKAMLVRPLIVLFLACNLGLITTFVATQKHSLDELATLGNQRGFVVIELKDLQGRPFQLLHYITNVDVNQLRQGKWEVVLVHSGCTDCEEAIAEKIAAIGNQSYRLAIIEVPPYSRTEFTQSNQVVRGRLTSEQKWFVETPLAFMLDDGIVK